MSEQIELQLLQYILNQYSMNCEKIQHISQY